MIFRKIAEWITGRKRDDSRHPLDYINNKYGEPVAAPKVENTTPATPIEYPARTEAVVAAVPTPVNNQITDAVTQAPAPTKCGCGRSPSGFCVGLHRLTAEEWNVHADNPARTVAEEKPKKRVAKPRAESAPKKAPAKPKKAEVKKPVAKKKAEPKKSAPAAKKSRAKKAQ